MEKLPLIDDHHLPGEIGELLPRIVEALAAQADSLAVPLGRTYDGHHMPSRAETVTMVELLRSVIFPGFFGNRDITAASLSFHAGATLDRVAVIMIDEIQRGLCFACERPPDNRVPAECAAEARRVTARFLERLPELRRRLALDALAAYQGDPAAPSPAEAIFCYPGVLALTSHRIAHELQLLGVPLIPRIISEDAHSRTGIDIHPGARIGERMFIDHGTGVVIGETCVIGDRVRIYQGVTLGARSFPHDEKGHPIKGIERHPIIEDDVVIYSGATVLGRVRIGAGSIIGGNVWLTRSVPPGSRISQARPSVEAFENGGGI
jgi:serine O-acetyltransferase